MASEHHLFEIAATGLDSSWSPCIQGYTWRCVYCTDPSAGTVSTTCSLPYSSTGEHLNASFKLCLLDRGVRPVPARTRDTSFQNCLMQRQEYLNKDGRFTVRCDIVVMPVTAKVDTFVTVPPTDLHRHLGDLLARKDGADVKFQLIEGSETFSAHRCVLAARSPVFRAQLFGKMMESKSTEGVIPIEGMEAQVFGSLLAFIYTDSLPPEVTGGHAEQHGDDDEAMVLHQHLLAAADRYGLERMKLVCQEKLCKHIRADSVAAMLVLADRHHCPGLKKACFDLLTSSCANLEAFTETDGFEVLNASCPGVLKELLAKLATVLIFRVLMSRVAVDNGFQFIQGCTFHMCN